MSMLVAGIAVFFGVHLVRAVAPEFRDRMIARLGPWGWRGAYSLVSIVGLALMAHGYAAAKPYSPWLWSLPVWTRHLAALVMLPALVLLFSAYLPGRIRRAVKHPMMIAVILWSGAHLAANGQAVDVLFFGSFLVWGIVVTKSAFSRVSASPPPSLPATPLNDVLAVGAGAGAWAWLAFGGHMALFGMPIFG
jgi:uncharacterized membrane protein